MLFRDFVEWNYDGGGWCTWENGDLFAFALLGKGSQGDQKEMWNGTKFALSEDYKKKWFMENQGSLHISKSEVKIKIVVHWEKNRKIITNK